MKFIHLTDCHLTPPGEKLFGIDGHRRLRAAVKSINRNHSDAAFCAITGDIAERGEVRAYQGFADIVGKLHCPYYVIPGNHDDRTVMRKVFPEWEWLDDTYLQYSVRNKKERFIFLDTVKKKSDAGELCAKRLAHLKRELSAAKKAGEPVYVFLHHPPMKIGIGCMDGINLDDDSTGKFRKALSLYPSGVKHLFFGHIHRICHGVWQGIPFSATKSIMHQIAPILDGRKEFVATREMPAYSAVLLEKNAVIVHEQSFLEDRKIIPDYP